MWNFCLFQHSNDSQNRNFVTHKQKGLKVEDNLPMSSYGRTTRSFDNLFDFINT